MDNQSPGAESAGRTEGVANPAPLVDLQLRWLGVARGVPVCVMLSGSGDGCHRIASQFLEWVRARGDGVLRLAPVSSRSGQRLPAGLGVQIRTQSTQAPVLVCVEQGHRFAGGELQALVDTVLRLGNGRAAMVLIVAPPGSTAVPRSCLIVDSAASPPPPARAN